MKIDEDFTVNVFEEEEKFSKQKISSEPLDLSKHDSHVSNPVFIKEQPVSTTTTDSKEITIEEHPVKTEFGDFNLVSNTQNETKNKLCDNYINKFTSKEGPDKNNQSSVTNSEGWLQNTNINTNNFVISYTQDSLKLEKSELPINNNKVPKATSHNGCQSNKGDQFFMEPIAKKIRLSASEGSNLSEKTGPIMTSVTKNLKHPSRPEIEKTTNVRPQNTGNQFKSKDTTAGNIIEKINEKSVISRNNLTRTTLLKNLSTSSEFFDSKIATRDVNSGINTSVSLDKNMIGKSPLVTPTNSSNTSKGGLLLKKVYSSGEFFDTNPKHKGYQNKSVNQQNGASRLVEKQSNLVLSVQKKTPLQSLTNQKKKTFRDSSQKLKPSIDIRIPQYSLQQKDLINESSINTQGMKQTKPDQNDPRNSAIVQKNTQLLSPFANMTSHKIDILVKRLVLEKDPEEQIRISKSLTEALNINDVCKEKSKSTEISTNIQPPQSIRPKSSFRRKSETDKNKRSFSSKLQTARKPNKKCEQKNLLIGRNSSVSSSAEFQSPQVHQRKTKTKSVSDAKKKANGEKDLPIFLPISPDLLSSLQTYVNNKSTENDIQISNDSTNSSPRNPHNKNGSTNNSLTPLPSQEGEISSTDNEYKEVREVQRKNSNNSDKNSTKVVPSPNSVSAVNSKKKEESTIGTPFIATVLIPKDFTGTSSTTHTPDSTTSNAPKKKSSALNHFDDTIICLSDSSDEEDNDVYFVPLSSSGADVPCKKKKTAIPSRIKDKISDLINSVMNDPSNDICGSVSNHKSQKAPMSLLAKSPNPTARSNDKNETLKLQKRTLFAKSQVSTPENSHSTNRKKTPQTQNLPKRKRGRPAMKTVRETSNFVDIPITPVLTGVTNEHMNETFNTVTEFLNGMLNPGPPPSTLSNLIGQVYAYRYGEQISQHFKQ